MRNSVVLPAPLGPTRPTFSPFCSAADASMKTICLPFCLLMLSSRSCGFRATWTERIFPGALRDGRRQRKRRKRRSSFDPPPCGGDGRQPDAALSRELSRSMRDGVGRCRGAEVGRPLAPLRCAERPLPTRGEGGSFTPDTLQKQDSTVREKLAKRSSVITILAATGSGRHTTQRDGPDNATTFDRMDGCPDRHFARHACGRTVGCGSGGYPERILQPARSSTRRSHPRPKPNPVPVRARSPQATALQDKANRFCAERKQAQGIRTYANALKLLGVTPVDLTSDSNHL